MELKQLTRMAPLDDDGVHLHLADDPYKSCRYLPIRHGLEVCGYIQKPLRDLPPRKRPLLSDHSGNLLAQLVNRHVPKALSQIEDDEAVGAREE